MNATADSFNLDRFVEAQDPVYAQVMRELGAGRKRTHWMWFVFPQIAGLGSSPISRFYAISSLAEAEAYLGHPLLGARLLQCVETLLAVEETDPHEIFGSPDDMKFQSSMTLFCAAAGRNSVFGRALDRFYGGKPDQGTLALLAAEQGNARK
ncbi:MAG: DUF1810 domain-containing protein [Shinella sp.]|nr:DUF1810 domain-containing protein [Shinella sp.]